LGVPETECRQLHRLGVTAATLQPWTESGIGTAFDWRLVTQSRLSLEQARRWRGAGLDGRFAAAATCLGADLDQVRDLVSDYVEGTAHRADLDDAWTDLAAGDAAFGGDPAMIFPGRSEGTPPRGAARRPTGTLGGPVLLATTARYR
jgi:hypothetical protein